MKNHFLLLVGVLVALGVTSPVMAQMHEGHHEKGSMMAGEHMMGHDESGTKLIEVGNKVCPVSGEEVGEMGKVVQIEYNGKLYNLCCAMCKRDFMKDPEKYSAIAEKEVRGE